MSISRLVGLVCGTACIIASSLLGANVAYVTNVGSNNVSVIDTATDTVVATIPVGTGPIQEWVSLDQSHVYVYNGTAGTVSVISTSTQQVIATITVGHNTLVSGGAVGSGGVLEAGAMTSDGHKLLIAASDDLLVSVIDTNSSSPTFDTVIATVTGLPNAPSLWTTGITPNNALAYVGNFNNPVVNVINLNTYVVIATITIGTPGGETYGVAVRSDGLFAYAPAGTPDATVSVIDTTTQLVVATITVGNDPGYLTLNPTGTAAYVSNFQDTRISVINTATNMVTATINVLSSPSFSLMNSAGTTTYVTGTSSGASSAGVNVIDNGSNKVVATVTFPPSRPTFSGLTPDQTQLYVPIPNNPGKVAVINTGTNTITATVGLGNTPFYVVFAPPFSSGPGAPGSPTGRQEADCFFDQIDLINVIQWTASTGSTAADHYNIYRNAALTDIAGSVSASSELKFKDHNRKKGVTYTYYIVAVSSTGGTSTAAVVTVKPLKSPCKQ